MGILLAGTVIHMNCWRVCHINQFNRSNEIIILDLLLNCEELIHDFLSILFGVEPESLRDVLVLAYEM